MNVLRSGDHGPKVVLAQLLLVTRAPHAPIGIDGHFGPATARAVQQFQALNPRLPQDGAIDVATWQALLTRANLATVDHVDVDDLVAALAQDNILQTIRQGHQFGLIAAAELARNGAAPTSVSIGMSNGVTQMIAQVLSSAAGRRIGLLRIYGHGVPGSQLVSSGRGVTGGSATHGAALTAQAVRLMRNEWGQLARSFAPYGSCELHGCRVAQGPSGLALLRELADLWRVPVSAGVQTQLVGRGRTARFEGPVRTAYPGGGTLRSWSNQVESAHGRVQYA
jgi:hypothetical protein